MFCGGFSTHNRPTDLVFVPSHAGTLPESLGNLTALQALGLNNNSFEGKKTLRKRTFSDSVLCLLVLCLTHIYLSCFMAYLSHNRPTDLGVAPSRTGTLPEYLGNLTKLTYLSVGGNQFSGE